MSKITLSLPAYDWAPREYQRQAWLAMLNPKIRKVVLAWARRHGKDECALHASCIRAMQRVGTYFYCLPEYAQARKVIWEGINPHTGRPRWRDVFPNEIIKNVNNQTMQIQLVNGSVFQLVGSDSKDSLMGTSPVGIVFSEAAIADPVTVAFFQPMLLENGGWSFHVSSVRGKNHFYKEFLAAQDREDAFSSHISAYDTDVFSLEDLEATKKEYIIKYGKLLGEALFNQEYLSSWEAAVVGAVWGSELQELERERRARPIKYDPRYPVHTSWDIGVGDSTVILYWQVIDQVPRMIDWFEVSGRGLQTCAEELMSKPYMYGLHIAPHDIQVRSWTNDGLSRIEEARKLGIRFTPTVRPDHKQLAISTTAGLIRRMEVNVHDIVEEDPRKDCRYILDTLKQYRYSYDEAKQILSKNPIHDWTSHFADALQTFAIFEATEGQRSKDLAFKVQGVRDLNDKYFNNVRLGDFLRKKKARSGAWG